MAGLVVLGVVLLLGLVLFTPLLVRATREEAGLQVLLHIGPARLRLYPSGEKAPPEEPAADRTGEEKQEQKQRKKEGRPLTAEQIFYLLEELPPFLGRTLGRLGRRVRVEPLRVYVRLSAQDPADTAILYGRAAAAVTAALPVLRRCLRIRDQDIRLYPDFEGQGMDYRLDVGIAIRLWDILVIGLCAGASGVKLLVGMKKLAPKDPAGDPEKPQKTNKSKTNGADAA